MPLFNISYQIILPDKNGEFLSEWEYCRKELIQLIDNPDRNIVKFNVFFHDSDPTVFIERKAFLKEEILRLFNQNCPAFGIIAQSPEKNSIALEIGTINTGGINLVYKNSDGLPYTVIEKNKLKTIWANGLEDDSIQNDPQLSASKAFDKALQILTAEGMTFNHIVRQWNYVGNILHREQKNNSLHQHYQLFNEVRNNYYSKYRTVGNFPAATGIGTAHEGMAIDICAAKIPDELRLSSLNSPIQVEPYLYSQKVLIGSPKINKTAPQFERAKILMNNHYSTVYISGTASIIGQKTIGIDDVQEQTRITIQNIESLVGSGNLQNHALFPTEVNLSREFKYIRVYVKKSGDIPAVKKICTQHFGNTPALYVQSDICRDDLLVEIEGELLLKTI